MKAITLTIQCDNAAFEPEPEYEIARILRELADKIESNVLEEISCGLHDINGNNVGNLHVINEPEGE